jgi:C4-dicarboxylate transporter, DctM subunit
MEWYVAGSLVLGLMIFLILAGVPIPFALGIASVVLMLPALGLEKLGPAIAVRTFGLWSSFGLMAIPLFVLVGEVVSVSGLGYKLYEAIYRSVPLPGGLAAASVIACALFGAVNGSSMVGAITIGTVAVPEMLRRGYDRRLATGVVAAGGTLSVLIPPSLIMIYYGVVTETNIFDLFVAGIIPGIIMTAGYICYVVLTVIKRPEKAPAPPSDTIPTLGQRLGLASKAWGVVFLAAIIAVPLYTGIATPTEVAGIGAFAALVVAVLAQRMRWRNGLETCLTNTARTMGFVGVLIASAITFGLVLDYYRVTEGIGRLVESLPFSPNVVLFAIIVFLFLAGMVMEPTSIVFIIVPIIFPAIEKLGFNPIWFGVVYTILMEQAVLTPPVGLNLYVIQGISRGKVSLGDVISGSIPFIIIQSLVIVLLFIFPQIALWLPGK